MAPLTKPLEVAIPFTGTLKLRIVPVTKIAFDHLPAQMLDKLDNALELHGKCENVPSGTSGGLRCNVVGSHGRKESHFLRVALEVEPGEGPRTFHVKSEDGSGKPVLNAVTHGLWDKGHVDVHLRVNMPHAPAVDLGGQPLAFDNPLHFALHLPPEMSMGAPVEVVPVVAPCFERCEITFEPFEKDVTTRAQASAHLAEQRDDDDYRDHLVWGSGKKAARVWRIGVEGPAANGRLLYAEGQETGDFEIAYDVTVKAPGDKPARLVSTGIDVVSLKKPELRDVAFRFVGSATTDFEVTGWLTGFHPECDIGIDGKLFQSDGGVIAAHPHGEAHATVADDGSFALRIDAFDSAHAEALRARHVGFFVAFAVAAGRTPKPTPFRQLASFDYHALRPLSHLLGARPDAFATGAVCTPCRTIDGAAVNLPIRLLHEERIRQIMPHATDKAIETYLPLLQRDCADYGIDDPIQIAHFLARVAVESGELRLVTEVGAPDYSGRGGNIDADDAKLFIGRGLLQLTLRANYDAFGKAVGEDFIHGRNAFRVAEPKWAVRSAVWYWKWRAFAGAARDSLADVIHGVNPGTKDAYANWRYLQTAYDAFEFPDRAERKRRNAEELKAQGYRYNEPPKKK